MTTRTSTKTFVHRYKVTTTTSTVDVVSGNQTSYSKTTQDVSSWSGTITRTMVGSENPKWREQVRKKQNATTGFVASSEKFIYSGTGSTTARIVEKVGNLRTTTLVTCDGLLPCSIGQVGVNPATLNDAISAASGKLLKKLAQLQTPFQGGVLLGELRETLHMIRHPAEALSKLVLGEQYLSTKAKMKRASMRKRRPLRGDTLKRSITRAAADTWLENAFGWQPFINDIESAMKVYNGRIGKPEYLPFRVTGSKVSPAGGQDITDWSVSGFVAYKTLAVKTYESDVHVYGAVRNAPNGVPGQLGLSWGQFIPTAWELLPWSFLVDYFSNIGDVLAGCSVDMGQVAWISHTRVNRGKNKTTFQDFRSIAGSGPESAIGLGGCAPVTREVKEVSRFDTFIVAAPRFRFEFPFSPRKWANMGALIHSVWDSGIQSSMRKISRA